ncbi:MAG: stage II sporulation protein M [Clostridia bacterium]|nr:stage II sporulation protein M [Clostridia bacterium]
MKRKYFFKTITDYISCSKVLFVLTFFCLVAGTVIGSLSAITMNTENYESLGTYMNNFLSAYTIQSVDRGEVFKVSLYNNVKTVLFLWVSGLCVWLIPLGVIQIAARGYKMGFTTVFLIQLYKGKGILFVLASLLPQIMILFPALIIYAVFNISYALSLHNLKKRGDALNIRKEMYLKNLVFLLGIIAVLVLCSFIDAFVVPPVLKPICSFLGR